MKRYLGIINNENDRDVTLRVVTSTNLLDAAKELNIETTYLEQSEEQYWNPMKDFRADAPKLMRFLEGYSVYIIELREEDTIAVVGTYPFETRRLINLFLLTAEQKIEQVIPMLFRTISYTQDEWSDIIASRSFDRLTPCDVYISNL